jgi:hypothetical protein
VQLIACEADAAAVASASLKDITALQTRPAFPWKSEIIVFWNLSANDVRTCNLELQDFKDKLILVQAPRIFGNDGRREILSGGAREPDSPLLQSLNSSITDFP